MRIQDLVPRGVRGWRGTDDHTYDRKTIYDYLDGGAEVYLQYDFRGLFARRFTREKQPAITIDLFDMGSGPEAYGIFSVEREGNNIGIGQGSEYAAGLLRFWKGRYFVAITAERETPEVKRAVLELGKGIAAAIKTTGTEPALISLVPSKGLVPNSIRYFHQHSVLSYLYFVARQNILRLDGRTQVVLAIYRLVKGNSYLLLIVYPNDKLANGALASFLSAYLPEGRKTGIARTTKGKWVAARAQGKLLTVVFDSPTKQWAKQMMTMVGQKERQRKR